ncbi:MAG: ribonucleotide-diphosphate reductase subunit beta [Candidatus Thiodiazotropha sp. (ex Lucina aurantia)]|uniref:Ribonucleoside-diphosphate reductase subunit beta n=1 Tax=Candidatus Thiodiazotropha taylori TaxID=2792791 RepID=A0A9E4TUJ4_9GAMM|nr:ribonucleotide-diphosphate reductase subunit beta [Candidatus Thiodiazotropha taylori]MBT3054039.1 ribonucleotide-diphosphate reductase subunit beta [Candidatus Thiodiazotropha sp. (ex Codakia orbicularis)]MBT3094649.1 ribonucleotide-diphosphate reductase subunit beta [Candidatus Thiodiazotropha sp. (ex Lucina pensylvanica)]MBV2102561.1 ribonucleotide-diphosphate reductase subunit beta [Candidatus Thiodiazotropha sp. (ex Lucina aurantia)]MCG8025970.1 ribonucleotide-diphosphate reductase subu
MLNWDDPLAKPAPIESTPAPANTETQPAHPHVVEEAARALQAEEQTEVDSASMEPVNPDDKRVINGMTDINQLAPFKYPWAWEYFLNANKNHWTPLDINMAQDVHDYQHKLTLEERHVYENVLSYLTTSDILAMRNIGLAVMEKMSAPELQIYQARQVYEESLHTWTYQHCIETIGLDQGEIYNRYRVVPEINKKIQITNRRLASILRADIDLRDPDELQNFVMAYIFFAAIFEGCWFYNGFSPIFALQRRGLMKGTAEQLQYIMRDEVLHASFGIRVVKQIIQEENITLDKQVLREMWDESEAAEIGYASYILRDPILGYSQEDHVGQFRFIANRRARQLGIDEPFPGAEATLPWLDEQAHLRKEKNFFETRVTEYQTGGALKWD